MAPGREERVMLRAYEIWQQEGRPEGRQEEHWRRAEQEVGNVGAVPEESGQNEVETTPEVPAASSE